ncbi:MAG: MBL fold metallo-hydrolase [Clostridiales Family XIII bacterium]|nr:MBL fold metallo-hydrolase [Clostridiales Family XIII bacterium]
MSNKLIQDIENYQPKVGACAFWWLGQLGYIVKTKQATMCFDPFLSPWDGRTVDSFVAPEELTGMDYIFGSHDHIDHIDHGAWPKIAKASPNARFVVPKKFVRDLSHELAIVEERFVGLDDDEVYYDAAKEIKITAIPSAHEFLARDPETGLHDSLGFIVDIGWTRCEDNRDNNERSCAHRPIRIYHSGDTTKYEGLETRLIGFRPIDLMFIPINGRDAARYNRNCIGNMSFAEAVDLAGMVAPWLVVPGHYEMFVDNSEDPQKFADYIKAKYPGQAYWIGNHAERVEL